MTKLADIEALIEADAALASLRDQVGRRFDGDPAHDLAHALRVADWTLRIGGESVEPRHAVAAALLHDVVSVPKDSSERSRASLLSAEVARGLLPPLGFDESAVDEIAEAIRDHSYSRGAVPKSDLGRALQDADRLEALGSLGIFRTVAAGVRMGAVFYHPADPWADQRSLDDSRFTLDHFFRKLLKLPPTMLSEVGRAEARRRVDAMKGFLRQLADEIGSDEIALDRALGRMAGES